jgi:hypothetical protein
MWRNFIIGIGIVMVLCGYSDRDYSGDIEATMAGCKFGMMRRAMKQWGPVNSWEYIEQRRMAGLPLPEEDSQRAKYVFNCMIAAGYLRDEANNWGICYSGYPTIPECYYRLPDYPSGWGSR